MKIPSRRLVAAVLVAGCALTACSSDDSSSSGATTSASSGGEANQQAFPVTIEHKYGSTTIPSAPERVVSVGYSDQDPILALGTVPIGIRDWYGEQPDATWPWAQPLLQGQHPTVLANDAINFEAVAALKPDLILGVSSGMTQEEYTTLSAIAPTVTQSGEFPDYGMPWQEMTRTIGKALGKEAEATKMVDEVEDRIASERAAHPEFGGQTGVIAYTYGNGTVGGYAPSDVRSQLLVGLGFTIPQPVIDRAGDKFYADFSSEEMGSLDADAVVWISDEQAMIDQLKADPVRQQMTAAQEGREVWMTDPVMAGAASFSSVLSLPQVLDWIVPELAAAVDGNTQTTAPAA